ncbi:YndM family protein [Bacillus tuaregi]|uniref:YndM family protein n=1 Tax=Bacillus tuaregi TaxID=1816695 RepID=UPI001F26114A|nr:YndM family protein [Bacillus tuaregi]
MKHLKALAIKFISTLALLYVILGLFYRMEFGNVFLISLVLGIVSYIIGDMLILPRTNNTVATLADFGLALLVIWFMSESFTRGDSIFTVPLLASLGVTLFEYFFHKYVANHVTREDQEQLNPSTSSISNGGS